MYTDTHCHLDYLDDGEPADAVLERARAEGVSRFVAVGVDLATSVVCVQQAMAYPDVWAVVGIHPHNAIEATEYVLDRLRQVASHPRVVGIGETGLDYYQMEERKGGRSVADMEWQRERFRTHIRAARRCAKPLIIHTREASADTIAILKEEGEDGSPGAAGGVFHCFTETMEVARAALDLGFYISFSGILTFRNAADLREVARFVPLDRMLIETDSPYLAPVPYRGKVNNPAYVPYVAAQVAELRGMTREQVGERTSRNFEALFPGVQS